MKLFSISFLRIAIACATLAPVLALGGCATIQSSTSAGSRAIGYVRRDLHAQLDATLSAAERAVDRAIRDARCVEFSEKRTKDRVLISGRSAEDEKVQIELTRVSDGATHIRVRVGYIGNKPLSHELLDKTRAAL